MEGMKYKILERICSFAKKRESFIKKIRIRKKEKIKKHRLEIVNKKRMRKKLKLLFLPN